MKVRPEEKQAMELLSRCVYTDKKLFLDDKPDIQSEDLSVGIEHRYITTPSAEMQAKFSDEYLKGPLHIKDARNIQKKVFPKSDFGFVVDDKGYVNAVIGNLSSKRENWKTNLFKTAYIDKMKKLNGNGYKSFLWYDVFFTLDKYWVLEDELPHMSQVAKKINSDTFWKRAFKNIFLLTPSCSWMINPESGKFEKIRIPPQ